MSQIEAKLAALGHALPEPLKLPEGVTLPFSWINIRGDRAFISGHGPQNPDGAFSSPFGQLGDEVSIEDGKILARKTALSMLASLHRELGSLDRITGWCRVFGMVNSAPGFDRQPSVINGFSELILELFGPGIGRHSRSAVGLAALPFNFAVEIEAEVLIAP
jgi:enamine deaminase RidA (YjgF/YER057c/UK114 family)